MGQLGYHISKIGPPLKMLETFSSSNFFIYGKFMILYTIPLMQTIKRSLKMFTTTNATFSTVESALSSIVANAMSIVAKDKDGLIGFYMYCFSTSRTWIHHFDKSSIGSRINVFISDKKSMELNFTVNERIPDERYDYPKSTEQSIGLNLTTMIRDMLTKKDERIIRALMMFPSILGGYSVYFFNQTVINKFVDPLTEAKFCIDR
jgi:hypothetical protein